MNIYSKAMCVLNPCLLWWQRKAVYADLRHIIEQAPQYLTENGYLLLEHGWQQGEKVRSIFQMNLWQNVDTCRDYGNNERVTLGRWANISDKIRKTYAK